MSTRRYYLSSSMTCTKLNMRSGDQHIDVHPLCPFVLFTTGGPAYTAADILACTATSAIIHAANQHSARMGFSKLWKEPSQ